MDYFRHFPRVDYKFGDEFEKSGTGTTVFEVTHDLGAYVDIIDTVRQNSAYYSTYYIQENDRPDIVSQKIYKTPAYHWTFYVMNDHIRERGWPLSMRELEDKVKRDFPHYYIETRNDLTGGFLPGERAVGSQSGASGLVVRRNLDTGIIFISSSRKYRQGESVTTATYTGNTTSVNVVASDFEYNAPRHYVDGNGDYVDIDPSQGPGALLTEVTYYDHYIKQNEELREIKVIRPDVISDVISRYFQTLRNI